MYNDFVRDGTDYTTNEPLWKVFVFLVFTLGLYSLYWAYVNISLIQFLKKQDFNDLSSLTLITFVCFPPMIFYYTFLKLFEMCDSNESIFNHIKTIILFGLLFIFFPLPFMIMQKKINKYFEKKI